MKWQTAGLIAYMILMTVYCVVTLVLSIIAYSKFSDSTQTYLNMAANYKESFIIDVAMSTTACSTGYSSLTSWDWSGTSAGCDCSSSTYLAPEKKMNLQSCNSTQTSKGCSQVNAISGMTLNYFGPNLAQKSNICVKRADASQAFYKIASSQTGQCTATQKQCGNPTLRDTIICVELSSPCPVYQIVYSAAANAVAYPSPEWTQLNTASGAYVYYNQKGTTATTLPSSELRFTQGSGVCFLDNNAKNLPSGTTDYILNVKKRTACTSTDTSFIDTSVSILESIYYQINLSSSDFANLLAQSGNPAGTSTYPFKAYRRPYINWKISERSKLKDFVESSDSVKDIKTAQLVCVIINIIVCLMIIALQVSQVYNLCGKDVPCISGSGEKEQIRIIRIKKILTYGSKLLQIPVQKSHLLITFVQQIAFLILLLQNTQFLLWAFILSAQKKGILRGAADASPSDQIYNIQMDAFATNIEDNVYSKNLGCLIMFGITLFVDILVLIYTCCCGKKDKKDSDDTKKHQNNQSYLDASQQPIQMTPNQPYPGNQQISPLNAQQPSPFQGIQLQPTPFLNQQPPFVPVQQQQLYPPAQPPFQQQLVQPPFQQQVVQPPFQQQLVQPPIQGQLQPIPQTQFIVTQGLPQYQVQPIPNVGLQGTVIMPPVQYSSQQKMY